MNTRRRFLKTSSGVALAFGIGVGNSSAAEFYDANGKWCENITACSGPVTGRTCTGTKGNNTKGGKLNGAACAIACQADDTYPLLCS